MIFKAFSGLFTIFGLVVAAHAKIVHNLTEQELNDLLYEKAKCSTLSCIHSSALILQKVNLDSDPCEDFYEFACGSYLNDQHTPDEKSAVDALKFMYEQLIEYLLRLFEHPDENTTRQPIHKYARNFFDSCMDTEKVDAMGMEPLRMLFEEVGGFPILRPEWDESKFVGIEQLILKFRFVINNATDNIFYTKKGAKDRRNKPQKFSADDLPTVTDVNVQLGKLLGSVATSLGGVLVNRTNQGILDLIKFEREIAEYQAKFKIFQKKFPEGQRKKNKEMLRLNKYMLYLDFIEANVYSPITVVREDEVPQNFNDLYVDFIKNTSNRTLQSFILWRFAQAALSFVDKDTRNVVLAFKKNTYGSEDNEQRWIFCTELVANVAPVGAGSVYIEGYFPKSDKNAADEMVDYLFKAYNDTLLEADWINDQTRAEVLNVSNTMHRFIGYHENMRKNEGYEFYNSLPIYPDHKDFMKTGMTFKIFAADREYKRAITKKREAGSLDEDWTRYARPATVNAFYNEKDNSIQFPAGVLAIPNFDKARPPFMNFGAIGAIIGHEITHSFDNIARKVDQWPAEAQRKFQERVECVKNQYSSQRVPEIEDFYEYFRGQQIVVNLNGTSTNNEDIADNGGLKLAYRAWRYYEDDHQESRVKPLGLETLGNLKMFWLSYAQVFCTIDRPEQMQKKIETDNHSLEKFRVNVPLMNMREFSEAWECPLGSPMNPEKKCKVW